MSGKHIKMATDQNFQTEILQSPKPALVDFWAEWCGPCRALAPIIDEIANDFEGQLDVYKMNVDENPDTPATYGVRGIPTLILFKDGKVANQSVGLVPKEQLVKIIQSAI